MSDVLTLWVFASRPRTAEGKLYHGDKWEPEGWHSRKRDAFAARAELLAFRGWECTPIIKVEIPLPCHVAPRGKK